VFQRRPRANGGSEMNLGGLKHVKKQTRFRRGESRVVHGSPFRDAPGGDSWIVIICLPCVETSLVHQQSAITHHTTPSRTSTTATRIPASKRTHKPIAAHEYSYLDHTLITRHSTQGLAPTIICDQTFSTGDDKQLSSLQYTRSSISK
jgi:hypothetical protein